MKNTTILFVALLGMLVLGGCKNNAGKGGDKNTSLISVKTLGLAYLEEFKLEEAEKEFLKFIDMAPKDKFGYANLGLTYLRMARYPDAEKQLEEALKIDPKDADVRLILATVYQMSDQRAKSVAELEKALAASPGHLKVLYQLSEMYTSDTKPETLAKRGEYLMKLVEQAPENLVPHMNLTEIYIRNGEFDKALAELEIIHKQFPEFPKEAVDFYNTTLKSLKKKDQQNALLQFSIFHNYLKVTAPYQAGVMDLKGPGGNSIGFPVITFDQPGSTTGMDSETLLSILKFTDATTSAGLDLPAGNNPKSVNGAHIEAADYDGDGDIDIYAGSEDASGNYRHALFNNDLGRFKDVTAASGLKHEGREIAASFTDVDNDGFLDLYISREGGDLLYHNNGKGKFEDVTSASGIKTSSIKSLFFDADQDGDLDLLAITPASLQLFRNNSDGTFTEQAAKMGFQSNSARDAAFGDFDEDGDLDLMVVNEKGSNTLYENQREGNFKDITEKSGLKSTGGSSAVAAGDYDNDGFLDLFIGGTTGKDAALYHNQREGRFEKVSVPELTKALQGYTVHAVKFIDFDNDGFLDLLAAGEPAAGGSKGLVLLHNTAQGKFTDVSSLLPETVAPGREINLFDYNDDGDLDILMAGAHGGISLLRNDGGNNNHYIKMKLVGLRMGSAKNNFFGIGAKVELRAGDLYQVIVVTEPNIHFGIGSRLKADVIRITWTNGVPQNMFFPGTDQSLIESQVLKGSCPFLYTWNGKEFTFVKDILWRSALGMPTGIMAGSTTHAFADASDDYLKIPGEMLQPKDGLYSMKVTSELWETIYLDKVELVAVDHPDSVDVYVPEQFTPPPFPGLKLVTVGEKIFPKKATDGDGRDVLPDLLQKDHRYVTGFASDRYQGTTEMHELILDPGKKVTTLFLTGWIFPTDASINVAMAQSSAFKMVAPSIEVRDGKGNWVTVVPSMGFPMGKDKTVIVDLKDKFLSQDHRVRIRTNMEIYWDQAFFSDGSTTAPVVTSRMDPATADLHYRGFSRSYRKGGRYGPHWFDYADVDENVRWRDLTGNYTRYGNVLPLLLEPDSRYIISNAGDETALTFRASDLPRLPAGWKRDFMIRSVGWVKDGDLNTAFGKTVEPLPFHGMKSYPPAPQEVYPTDAAHRQYLREYNTRKVTADPYLNALRK
jgi:hypothetical protein